MTRVWFWLNILAWIVHLPWVLWGAYLVTIIFSVENFLVAQGITWIIWLVLVIACRGCPFGYLHDWLRFKAGETERRMYSFHSSLAYKLIINPLMKLWKITGSKIANHGERTSS